MPKPTDNKKISALMDYFEAGMPITEIAELLGLHYASVHRILVRIGLKEPSPDSAKRLTNNEKMDIVKLYNDGITVEQIMELIGCSKPTVYRYVHKAGLNREIPKNNVEQAIETYLNTKISVNEICKQFGLSKPTFYRRLKAHTEK